MKILTGFLFFGMLALSGHAATNQCCHEGKSSDKNKCPQSEVTNAFWCEVCEVVYAGDDTEEVRGKGRLCKKCLSHKEETKVVKVKACERSYWQADDCKDDQNEVSLKANRCQHGVYMTKHTDLALLVDKCGKCEAWALPGEEVKHDMSKHKEECGGNCCGGGKKNDQTDTIKNALDKCVDKHVCLKSGKFPHVKTFEYSKTGTSSATFANPKLGICPVMGSEIDESVTTEYKGKRYAFCCPKCIKKFLSDPAKYLGATDTKSDVYTCPMHPEVTSPSPGRCPKCGMDLTKKG